MEIGFVGIPLFVVLGVMLIWIWNSLYIITRDNVSVKVNAVCYFRVVDANLAMSQVQNYQYATSQLAQTTLRSIVGQFELDEILSQRDKVNAKLQIILDTDTEPWGIKVSKVEVKQVDIPEQM